MVTLLRLLNVNIMTKSLAVFTCKLVLYSLIVCGYMLFFWHQSGAVLIISLYAKYNDNKSIQFNYKAQMANMDVHNLFKC